MTQFALSALRALGFDDSTVAMPRKRPAPVTTRAPRVGASSLAGRFCAGHYAAIVRDFVDGGTSNPFESSSTALQRTDVAHVVGALAFVGRLEEARALFASQLRLRTLAAHDTESIAARFFLGVAYCRAGRSGDAEREFRANLVAECRHGSPIARFYGVQGLACLRFFTGRLREAASHALSALELAFSAGFAYGRLLATDLRGHALVQLGQVQAGLSLLETARTLAESLDLPGNVAVLDCTRAIYRARFGVVAVDVAIAELVDLLGRSPDDSYSRRSMQIELAIQRCIAGEGNAAWALLEQLTVGAIPDGGDARTRLRLLLACAHVTGLRYGLSAAAPYLAEARQIPGTETDVALTIDRLCLELLVTTDSAAAACIVTELRELERASRVTRSWLHTDALTNARALEEDRLGALLFACRNGTAETARHLLQTKRLGLIPLALRLTPGRRVLLFGRRLVLEDHGDVSVAGEPSDGTLRFLRALGTRDAKTKEALLAQVWGIAHYRPDAHDPVVHTAVSRARALLGVRGHWIEAEGGGYRFATGVELIEVGSGERDCAPAFEVSPPESAAAIARSTLFPEPIGVPTTAVDPVMALLARQGPLSTREVAKHLGVSEMTALRRLRAVCDKQLARREGLGKNTRYHAASMPPATQNRTRS